MATPMFDSEDFYESQGWDEPDNEIFLGSESGWDLYITYADDEEGDHGSYELLAIRYHDDEWDYYSEEVSTTIESKGTANALLVRAYQKAVKQGIVTAPQDEIPRDALVDVPDRAPQWPIPHKELQPHAVYLGALQIDGRIYETYYTQNPENKAQTYVYATWSGDGDYVRWQSDGTLPTRARNYNKVLIEAIRRAQAQGFDFKVEDDYIDRLTAETVLNTATPNVTTGNMTKKQFKNVTIVESADEQIHLPLGMTPAQGREWLTQHEKNNDQVIQWAATIDAFPLDGALALRNVLARRFGTSIKAGATEETFFGKREVPPHMIAVQTGVDQVEYVPWGYFQVSAMPDCKVEAGVEFKEKQLYFHLHGDIRRKYKPIMDSIADEVREELRKGSIYKGKAFRIRFPTDQEMSERGYNPTDYAPTFMGAGANIDQLILPDQVFDQISTNVFTPVAHTQQCREHNIPLKRGVLLAGRYGTGKTLTAAVLSKLCTDNGWTFIYVSQASDLERAMRFARRYEPAVIFAEDIDSVLVQKEGSARDKAMNDILNTIDGVDMKAAELMVVLTSNFVTKINKAMLRPGRLDAVILVEPPDEKAVLRLMRFYAKDLLARTPDADLIPAAQLLAGQIPSVIREVVERSKLAAIRRSAAAGERFITLQGSDLLSSAQGILAHVKLLEEAPADNRSDIEKAAATLGNLLTQAPGLPSARLPAANQLLSSAPALVSQGPSTNGKSTY